MKVLATRPQQGRVLSIPQETYGEDPFLSAELGASFVQGLQGPHPRYVKASAGCKHFSVHGGPENLPVSRYSFDAKVRGGPDRQGQAGEGWH